MYCGKCGTQNQDGAMFCRECGASLNASSPVPAGADSGNLLYQSNGAKRSISILYGILAVFLLAISIGCFVAKNAKYEASPVRTGYQDSNGNIVWSSKPSGYIGGGDVLTKDGKEAALVCGIICLSMGCGLLCYAILFGIMLRRCWLKVYSDHVESYAGLMNDYVHCAHKQIQSVQMFKNGIVLTTGGTKRKIMCKEPQKAFDIVNQCYMNALQARP